MWTDPDRTDRLARLYNDRFNNLVPRAFDGSHLLLPGASGVITLRAHQKRAIWRIVCTGNTYLAHCVGAGKTFVLAAAVMEQKRLGLVSKPIMPVPSHCLAQASREFSHVAWSRRVGAITQAPVVVQAMRTEIGRPSSSMWFSTWTATSTSVARRRSVRERSPSPMTRLNRLMAASARARFV